VGGLHNAALTQEGRIWTWGCNDDGALGRGTCTIHEVRTHYHHIKTDGDEFVPAPVEGLENVFIVKVCCGSSHTIALDANGFMYSWGTYRNSGGILG
jgi:regulator of chromosome condensation